MPKASVIAADLRKLADALDSNPDVELVVLDVSFWCHSKAQFIAAAQFIHRPAAKRISSPGASYARLYFEHQGAGIKLAATAEQSVTCRIVEPAKPAVYDCEPILSMDEEATVLA